MVLGVLCGRFEVLDEFDDGWRRRRLHERRGWTCISLLASSEGRFRGIDFGILSHSVDVIGQDHFRERALAFKTTCSHMYCIEVSISTVTLVEARGYSHCQVWRLTKSTVKLR